MSNSLMLRWVDNQIHVPENVREIIKNLISIIEPYINLWMSQPVYEKTKPLANMRLTLMEMCNKMIIDDKEVEWYNVMLFYLCDDPEKGLKSDASKWTGMLKNLTIPSPDKLSNTRIIEFGEVSRDRVLKDRQNFKNLQLQLMNIITTYLS